MSGQAWVKTRAVALFAGTLTLLAGCCSLDRPAPAPVVKVIRGPAPSAGSAEVGRDRGQPDGAPEDAGRH
jgi:hypothetical protein